MTSTVRALLLVAGVAATSGVVRAQSPADIEKGREVVGQSCIQCHTLRAIQSQRKSQEQWRDTVYSMITRGGMILPDEIEPVTAYLTRSFGPDSPQTASSARVPGTNAPDPGRALVERSCIQCHDAQTTLGKKATSDEWNRIIARMVGLGAKLQKEEQQSLLQYLSGKK